MKGGHLATGKVLRGQEKKKKPERKTKGPSSDMILNKTIGGHKKNF